MFYYMQNINLCHQNLKDTKWQVSMVHTVLYNCWTRVNVEYASKYTWGSCDVGCLSKINPTAMETVISIHCSQLFICLPTAFHCIAITVHMYILGITYAVICTTVGYMYIIESWASLQQYLLTWWEKYHRMFLTQICMRFLTPWITFLHTLTGYNVKPSTWNIAVPSIWLSEFPL